MDLLKHSIAAFATYDGGLSVCCLVLASILAIPLMQPSRGPNQKDLRAQKWGLPPFTIRIPLNWRIVLGLAIFFYMLAWQKI
jgi:hypothetical protein